MLADVTLDTDGRDCPFKSVMNSQITPFIAEDTGGRNWKQLAIIFVIVMRIIFTDGFYLFSFQDSIKIALLFPNGCYLLNNNMNEMNNQTAGLLNQFYLRITYSELASLLT